MAVKDLMSEIDEMIETTREELKRLEASRAALDGRKPRKKRRKRRVAKQPAAAPVESAQAVEPSALEAMRQ